MSTVFFSDLDDRLAVIRSLGHTVRALNEIALLQDSCPLAAEIAVRGLREVKAEVAPDAELPDAEHEAANERAREACIEANLPAGQLDRLGIGSVSA